MWRKRKFDEKYSKTILQCPPCYSVIFKFFLKKMGQPRPLFVYFRSFRARTNFTEKNCRHQRDSDRRSGRQARWPLDHHHDALLSLSLLVNRNYQGTLWKCYSFYWLGLSLSLHFKLTQITIKPWSSGYGRRLTFWRSWVRIPAPYTEWTFFTYFCCKNL